MRIWQKYLKRAQEDETRARQLLKCLIPNAFSFLNLSCGIMAIVLSIAGYLYPAVALILIGIFCDALDGRLARRLNAFSRFGETLDSKADMITFGVAPAVVIFESIRYVHPSFVGSLYAGFLGIIFFGSVFYRLRRFSRGGHSQFFDGLPSPIGAAIVILAAISLWMSSPWIVALLTCAISGLMVSRIQYAHLEIASRHPILKWCRIPTLILMAISIFNLFRPAYHDQFHHYELLLGFIFIYVLSPLFVKSELTV